MIDIRVDIEENIASSLGVAEETLKKGGFLVTEDVKNDLVRNIQEEFEKPKTPPLSPSWAKRKAKKVGIKPILHYYEVLAHNVRRLPAEAKVERHAQGWQIDFGGAFDTSPYVVTHELGSVGPVSIPARPFIIPAVERTAGTSSVKFDALFASAGGTIDRGLGRTRKLKILRGRHLIPWWAFWALPLSQIYLFFGLYSDITSYMRGTFLKPGAARAWVLAYFQGRFLVTKKTIRRRFRRELWRKR